MQYATRERAARGAAGRDGRSVHRSYIEHGTSDLALATRLSYHTRRLSDARGKYFNVHNVVRIYKMEV